MYVRVLSVSNTTVVRHEHSILDNFTGILAQCTCFTCTFILENIRSHTHTHVEKQNTQRKEEYNN